MKFERLCDIIFKNEGGYKVKIIHCSDLHLDSPLGSVFPPEKAAQRNAELCAAFARMVRYARQEQVSAVLIAGDLFDGAYVSERTAEFVAEQIRAAREIRFFYLRGNHDADCGAFADSRKPDNLITFTSRWESHRCGGAVITAIEPEGDAWLEMYAQLQLSGDDLNIVMLHGQTAAQPGKEQIALPLLRGKGIRYLALGHLHSYSSAQLDADGVYCYCGCMEGRGFDECGDKGFVLLDIADGRLRSRFVPFAARTLHEISVDISGAETVTRILSLMKSSAAETGPEDPVKFVLTGTYTLQTQKDPFFLQKMLEPEFWHVRIKDETVLHIDHSAYEYDVSLKGEFIRTVMASDRSAVEKARIISCGIRALSGQEVGL